jgi:hypothetical protein
MEFIISFLQWVEVNIIHEPTTKIQNFCHNASRNVKAHPVMILVRNQTEQETNREERTILANHGQGWQTMTVQDKSSWLQRAGKIIFDTTCASKRILLTNMLPSLKTPILAIL